MDTSFMTPEEVEHYEEGLRILNELIVDENDYRKGQYTPGITTTRDEWIEYARMTPYGAVTALNSLNRVDGRVQWSHAALGPLFWKNAVQKEALQTRLSYRNLRIIWLALSIRARVFVRTWRDESKLPEPTPEELELMKLESLKEAA